MKSPRLYIPPSLNAAVVCMVLICFVFIGLGVGHVASRQKVIQTGYQLNEAMVELRQLREENRRLRVERSVLTNPQRIEKLAQTLGMGQPTSGQIRVVRTDADAEWTPVQQ